MSQLSITLIYSTLNICIFEALQIIFFTVFIQMVIHFILEKQMNCMV